MKDRPSILVIEDEGPIRDLIKKILRKYGYSVNEAGSVAAAYNQLKRKKFDLITLDLTLPDGWGLDILDEISDEYRNRVIVLSGTGTVDMAVEAMRKGAFDFLTKPLDFNVLKVLLVTVKKALRFNQELTDTGRSLQNEVHHYKKLSDALCEENKILKEKLGRLSETKEDVITGKEAEKYKAICGAVTHGLKGEFMHIGYSLKEIRELGNTSKEILEETALMERSFKYSQLLLQRLLNFLEMGVIQRESIVLSELIKEIDILAKPRLASNIHLNVKIAPIIKKTRISANLQQLIGVLLELINNASKALCQDGGTIDIKIEEKNGKVAISVKDNGAGIPLELKKKIFKEQVTSKSGSGYGLYLCSKVVAEFDGQLNMRTSKKGTKFTIILSAVKDKQE